MLFGIYSMPWQVLISEYTRNNSPIYTPPIYIWTYTLPDVPCVNLHMEHCHNGYPESLWGIAPHIAPQAPVQKRPAISLRSAIGLGALAYARAFQPGPTYTYTPPTPVCSLC